MNCNFEFAYPVGSRKGPPRGKTRKLDPAERVLLAFPKQKHLRGVAVVPQFGMVAP